jgi:GDP-mannose 6-dehydrogenase
MLKYACNSFHALKVTYANEIGRLGKQLGVDSREVMRLLCQDTRLNISPAYLRPGFAFGGSCLPKDLKALLYLAKDGDVELPMLQAILPSNREHIERAVQMVLASGRRAVGMAGLSFKAGTDDLRESPLVILAERFLGKGLNLKIYDPDVQLARLMGANRRYIEETIPHIASVLCPDAEALVAHSEVLVLGHPNADVIAALRARRRRAAHRRPTRAPDSARCPPTRASAGEGLSTGDAVHPRQAAHPHLPSRVSGTGRADPGQCACRGLRAPDAGARARVPRAAAHGGSRAAAFRDTAGTGRVHHLR